MSHRVVVWGTGNVGRHALRAIAERPELELAAVYVTSAAKHGKDAGELAGLGRPLGVTATTDNEAILATDANCVIHAPLPSAQVGDDPDLDAKQLAQLLSSGKNVVTTVGFMYPRAHGQALVDQLEQACQAGGVSLHGTGFNPGFMGDALLLTLSGLASNVSTVSVRESAEFSRYPSREIILDMMGFGKTPQAYQEHSVRYRRWLSGLFIESVHMVADGLDRPVTDVRVDEDVALTDDPLDIAAGHLDAGTVAAQRWRWTGVTDGADWISLEAVYRAHSTAAPAWAEPGWVIDVDGQPAMTLRLPHWISDALLATAMHAVNAIPAVCRAEPGIRTFLDLPLIVGRSRA